MVKVKYSGSHKVILHQGEVAYEVNPGDELELGEHPGLPGFEEVKPEKAPPKGVNE